MRNNRFEIFANGIGQVIKSMQCLKSKKMAQYGLKGTTCRCLCQILESDAGLTAGELAALGEIDKAQVSRCVGELTEKGFVYREELAGRCYKQKYRLTELGKRAAQDITETAQYVQEVVREGISEKDIEAFYRVLDQLCGNLERVLERIR